MVTARDPGVGHCAEHEHIIILVPRANIGSILATSFKFCYSKMCRCTEEPPQELPKERRSFIFLNIETD